MNTVTFILFSFNEEKRIAYAIRNLIQFGEVCILDGGSTDKTKEISESLGAKFYTRPDATSGYVETEANFQFVKSIAKTDWIYWGYTDNIAPKSLLTKFIELSKQDRIKLAFVPLHTYIWGDTKHFALKSYAPMIFHKDFMDFKGNYIHGMGKFIGTDDQKMFLPNTPEFALKHFSTYNGRKFILGHLKYAETEAENKFKAGKKFSLFLMLAAILRYFWIYGRYSWRCGKLGVIILLHYACFRLMSYTKLYELEHDLTLETIEGKYGVEKEKLLQEFN